MRLCCLLQRKNRGNRKCESPFCHQMKREFRRLTDEMRRGLSERGHAIANHGPVRSQKFAWDNGFFRIAAGVAKDDQAAKARK